MSANVGRYVVILLAVLVLAVVFFAVSGQPGLTVGPSQTTSTPVPTAEPTPTPVLGNPSGVSAAHGVIPDSPPGSIVLRWIPASNATLHLIYLVKSDGSDRRYWPVSDGAYVETITGLEIGQTYWLTVIAGRAGAGNGSVEWSQWSDWVEATPALPGLPPPPTRPQASATPANSATPASSVTPTGTETPTRASTASRYVEIEGNVISVDAAAETFEVQVVRHEYFGSVAPPDQVTVNYSGVRFIANWISSGLYIEAEGTYDATSTTLYAHEVEREDQDDDDDDDNGDDDDDDDGDDSN